MDQPYHPYRRSTDAWTSRLQEVAKIIGLLISLILAITAFVQNIGQGQRLDQHKAEIKENTDLIKQHADAVNEIADKTGLPVVAEQPIAVTERKD